MEEQYDTSVIEESANKLLDSLSEISVMNPDLSAGDRAEHEFLRQVFRPICYYLVSYNIPVPQPTISSLLETVLSYDVKVDDEARNTLLEAYVNPPAPTDWTLESQKIRNPKNLFTIPSPDPLLRLSYTCHLYLPKPIRQHLALVFYFGGDDLSQIK
jgi:hypothetical protein